MAGLVRLVSDEQIPVVTKGERMPGPRFAAVLFFVCAVAGAAFPVSAQTRKGLVFQAGPTVNAWGSSAEILYFSHWTDQWAWEAGAGHRLWFLPEHPPGHAVGVARIRYLLDIFRLLPSLYIGAGAGWMPDENVSVVEFQYGIAVDYMLSRRYLLGLDVSGASAVFSEEIPDAQGALVSAVNRFQVLLRLQWVWGETW